MPARTVNGTALFYEESGRGTPLVLVHGFPLDQRMWQRQREALSDRFRVIAPDLRGFGQSTSRDRFTMDSLADDLRALLAEVGALPCVLAGLSMGGYVALAFAKKHPTDLRALILVDTKAEGDTPEGKDARNKLIELVRAEGPTAVAEQMMPKMLAPDAASHRPAVSKELRAIMEACPQQTIEHALQALRDRPDRTADLASLAVPTLILVGESDAITPPAVAESMQRQIPNAQLQIIRGAGHMAPMEQPEQVNRAIQEFAAAL